VAAGVSSSLCMELNHSRLGERLCTAGAHHEVMGVDITVVWGEAAAANNVGGGPGDVRLRFPRLS